jgi:hypothetical protein
MSGVAEARLVMVDKERLAELRANLNAAVETARADPSLPSLWLTVGAIASVLDALLGQIVGGDD